MKQSLRWEAAWCELHQNISGGDLIIKFTGVTSGGEERARWQGWGVSVSAINTGKDSVNIHGPSAVQRLVEDTRKQERPGKWGITSECGEQKGYQHAFIHSFIHSTSVQPVRIDGGAWQLEPGWLLGWLQWCLDRQGLDFKSELKSLEESSSEVLNLFAIP